MFCLTPDRFGLGFFFFPLFGLQKLQICLPAKPKQHICEKCQGTESHALLELRSEGRFSAIPSGCGAAEL